jgi:hypothetical protein
VKQTRPRVSVDEKENRRNNKKNSIYADTRVRMRLSCRASFWGM